MTLGGGCMCRKCMEGVRGKKLVCSYDHISLCVYICVYLKFSRI